MGINVNGENLNHLRFADDTVLVSDKIDHAREMLNRLDEASRRVGLKINTSETQYI